MIPDSDLLPPVLPSTLTNSERQARRREHIARDRAILRGEQWPPEADTAPEAPIEG